MLLAIAVPQPAQASTLSAEEIQLEMLNKTIITRRFGRRITMRYLAGGVVTASALLAQNPNPDDEDIERAAQYAAEDGGEA